MGRGCGSRRGAARRGSGRDEAVREPPAQRAQLARRGRGRPVGPLRHARRLSLQHRPRHPARHLRRPVFERGHRQGGAAARARAHRHLAFRLQRGELCRRAGQRLHAAQLRLQRRHFGAARPLRAQARLPLGGHCRAEQDRRLQPAQAEKAPRLPDRAFHLP